MRHLDPGSGLLLISVLAATQALGATPYGPRDVYANVPPIDDRGRDQLTMFNAWNPDPVGNHDRNLASVRPELAEIVRRAQVELPNLRFVVGSGLRSPAEQRLAEIWGWSPRRSAFSNPSLRKHLEGRAVDLWPLDGNGRVTFDPALQARIGAAMMRVARSLGVPISWGGNWRGRKDPTHFELMP